MPRAFKTIWGMAKRFIACDREQSFYSRLGRGRAGGEAAAVASMRPTGRGIALSLAAEVANAVVKRACAVAVVSETLSPWAPGDSGPWSNVSRFASPARTSVGRRCGDRPRWRPSRSVRSRWARWPSVAGARADEDQAADHRGAEVTRLKVTELRSPASSAAAVVRTGVMPLQRANEVELYYELRGDGPPLLLMMGASGYGGVLGGRGVPGRRVTVVTYDRRGTGRAPSCRLDCDLAGGAGQRRGREARGLGLARRRFSAPAARGFRACGADRHPEPCAAQCSMSQGCSHSSMTRTPCATA